MVMRIRNQMVWLSLPDRKAKLVDEDPIVIAFLSFLENELKKRPDRRTRLSKNSIRRAVRLTRNVKVNQNESLPENVTF